MANGKSVEWQVKDKFGYGYDPYQSSTFGDGNYLGSEFGYLRDKYKGLIESGDPSVALFRDQAVKQAGRARGRALSMLEDAGAQSGFGGVVNANLMNQVLEQESVALGESNVQATQMEQASRERAMAQLLGMTQFEGNMAMQTDQFQEGIRQFDITTEEGRRRFRAEMAMRQREFELAQQAQEGSFWDFAGQALGTGIGFFTGQAGMSLASNLFGGKKGGE